MDIGERMKSYEAKDRFDKGAVCIRIDGKTFHTWSKKAKLERPYSEAMHQSMVYASQKTAGEMQGFRIGYTQSDESTFILTNTGIKESGWFDYKVQKLVSVSASLFTYYFNSKINELLSITPPPAIFDSRAFQIPIEDAANSLVWRELDNKRNVIQALAAHYLSSKQILGMKNSDLVKILERDHGVTKEALPGWIWYGTFFTEDGMTESNWLTYQEIVEKGSLNATY